MPVPKTPIEEGFERIFGNMKNIDTPEDTELRDELCLKLGYDDGIKGRQDILVTEDTVDNLMNLITLHTKEAYKKGYIDGGIAQLTNPTERKA